MVSQEEIEQRMREVLAERDAEKEMGEGMEFSAQDLTQLFEKIMNPKKTYGVITKDLKTSNLDKFSAAKVISIKSIAKDFGVFKEAFGLENDIWIRAVSDSIDADAEIMQAASQGFAAKLLDTFVTMKRESRIVSRLEKEKRGLIFK